jgi:hypothetical protein
MLWQTGARVGNPQAVHVKARAVLRHYGHSEADHNREYADWHIEIRSGSHFISIWYSATMVYLSLANVPVFYRPGPWEQYLDRLFSRTSG